jgi:hypothetical protein
MIDQKRYLKKVFKDGPVSDNIEKLLFAFQSEQFITDFFIVPVIESDLSNEDKSLMKEVISESIKEMIEGLVRQKNGSDILNQISY